MNIVSKGTGPG